MRYLKSPIACSRPDQLPLQIKGLCSPYQVDWSIHSAEYIKCGYWNHPYLVISMVYPQLLRTTEVVVWRPRTFLVSIVVFIGRRCDIPYLSGGTISMKAVWRMLMYSTRVMTAAVG